MFTILVWRHEKQAPTKSASQKRELCPDLNLRDKMLELYRLADCFCGVPKTEGMHAWKWDNWWQQTRPSKALVPNLSWKANRNLKSFDVLQKFPKFLKSCYFSQKTMQCAQWVTNKKVRIPAWNFKGCCCVQPETQTKICQKTHAVCSMSGKLKGSESQRETFKVVVQGFGCFCFCLEKQTEISSLSTSCQNSQCFENMANFLKTNAVCSTSGKKRIRIPAWNVQGCCVCREKRTEIWSVLKSCRNSQWYWKYRKFFSSFSTSCQNSQCFMANFLKTNPVCSTSGKKGKRKSAWNVQGCCAERCCSVSDWFVFLQTTFHFCASNLQKVKGMTNIGCLFGEICQGQLGVLPKAITEKHRQPPFTKTNHSCLSSPLGNKWCSPFGFEMPQLGKKAFSGIPSQCIAIDESGCSQEKKTILCLSISFLLKQGCV